MQDHVNFTFYLGGRRRHSSLVEYAWRLDLYNRSRSLTEGFATFLGDCHKHLPEHMVNSDWWTIIANGVYVSGSAPKGMIM